MFFTTDRVAFYDWPGGLGRGTLLQLASFSQLTGWFFTTDHVPPVVVRFYSWRSGLGRGTLLRIIQP